jgi:hypothetical protein
MRQIEVQLTPRAQQLLLTGDPFSLDEYVIRNHGKDPLVEDFYLDFCRRDIRYKSAGNKLIVFVEG